MKKIFGFIPTIIMVLFYLLLLMEGQLGSITMWGWILLVFFSMAGLLLATNKWFGCLLGIISGLMIIYSGMQEHGQLINERLIGIVICVYYVIMGYICLCSQKKK